MCPARDGSPPPTSRIDRPPAVPGPRPALEPAGPELPVPSIPSQTGSPEITSSPADSSPAVPDPTRRAHEPASGTGSPGSAPADLGLIVLDLGQLTPAPAGPVRRDRSDGGGFRTGGFRTGGFRTGGSSRGGFR